MKLVNYEDEHISEETGKIVPAVTERIIDSMAVSKESFVPIMMKAIQQLSDKVTALESA